MRRNILKNPRAEGMEPYIHSTLLGVIDNQQPLVFADKFKDWEILENGGDQWTVEDVMVPHPNETVKKNFVTSYG